MASLELQSFRFGGALAGAGRSATSLRRTLWPDEVTAEPWRYGPPVGI